VSDETTRIRERLVREFPHVFQPKGWAKPPLKVGIHRDILERLPDLFTHQVRAALRDYTGGPTYLRGLKAGALRFDLDGKWAGNVTEDEAKSAKQRLDEITSKTKEGTHTMCGSKSVSTSSYVSDPAATDIHPVNLSAEGELDRMIHLVNSGNREGALELLRARDQRNVDHGRGTPFGPGGVETPAPAIKLFSQNDIAEKLNLILSLIPTKKIEAIKETRALSGMGLKEAKDWVEGFHSRLPVQATAPVAPPPSDPFKPNGFMVLRRNSGNIDYELYSTEDYASWAKSNATELAKFASPKDEILVVKVLGQSKLVFEMLDAA
jgi:hypothetical protein